MSRVRTNHGSAPLTATARFVDPGGEFGDEPSRQPPQAARIGEVGHVVNLGDHRRRLWWRRRKQHGSNADHIHHGARSHHNGWEFDDDFDNTSNLVRPRNIRRDHGRATDLVLSHG